MPEAANHGFLSLVPLIITLFLAFWKRDAVLALFIGCIVGVVLLGMDPAFGFSTLAQEALGNADFIWVLLIQVFIGIMIAFFMKAGVVKAFAELVAGKVKSPRGVKFATWLIGLFTIDDYMSPLLRGVVMRPLTDEMHVSREKLSFMLDSTCASVCTLMPFMAWGAYVAGLVADLGGPVTNADQGLSVYIHAIPFNFYAILMVLITLLSALEIFPDFGPMRTAERRARETGKVLRDGAVPMVGAELEELQKGGDSDVKPNVTLDGTEIQVYANIGGVGDVGLVLQNDAQGIGLFRSEFLYLDGDDYPTEEEQFAVYKRVVETMAGKKVVIRTLDIGADKQAGYFGLDHEENPALGYRAIRICLTRRDVFKTQLRAILRASAFGTVSIMFPMIISVREVRDAKEILEECRAELKAQGVPMGEVEIGVMIETPASVMIADELAQEVQFFSLGTNDLTQYTLAIDRQNPKLDAFYNPHHPAILRMIRQTIEAGHRHGCWVGICGELGADPVLTETFLRMGIDELSVSPAAILPLRKRIRELDLSRPAASEPLDGA